MGVSVTREMLMNGSAMAAAVPGVAADPAVVQLVEGLLADARAGRLRGIGAVVVQTGGQIGTVMHGDLPAIVVGAELMKRTVLDHMTGRGGSPAIMRVR
jgi:hypothetical protein